MPTGTRVVRVVRLVRSASTPASLDSNSYTPSHTCPTQQEAYVRTPGREDATRCAPPGPRGWPGPGQYVGAGQGAGSPAGLRGAVVRRPPADRGPARPGQDHARPRDGGHARAG